jgi:hypothetical protein
MLNSQVGQNCVFPRKTSRFVPITLSIAADAGCFRCTATSLESVSPSSSFSGFVAGIDDELLDDEEEEEEDAADDCADGDDGDDELSSLLLGFSLELGLGFLFWAPL